LYNKIKPRKEYTKMEYKEEHKLLRIIVKIIFIGILIYVGFDLAAILIKNTGLDYLWIVEIVVSIVISLVFFKVIVRSYRYMRGCAERRKIKKILK
jgi:hypothetical protein